MKTVCGYVKKVNHDSGRALVVLMEGRRCSECLPREGEEYNAPACEACVHSRRRERVASNPVGAEAGDTVSLESRSFNLVRVLLWSIPVVIAAATWLAVSSYGVETSAVMAAASVPASVLALYLATGRHTFLLIPASGPDWLQPAEEKAGRWFCPAVLCDK